PRPEVAVFQAIRANPITAPYPISTSWRDGRVVLSGVVGTKTIHDTAIRIAIDIGYPINDELKIDTSAAHRVAAYNASAATMMMGGAGPGAISPALGGVATPGLGGNPYYIYPPPLFGRLDDPFYGFEPPLLSYPPWWRAMSAREPINLLSGQGLGAAGMPAQ